MSKKIIQRWAGGVEDPANNIDNIDGAGEPVTLALIDGVYWLQSHATNCCKEDKPDRCICPRCMIQHHKEQGLDADIRCNRCGRGSI